jgi:hypothetical protein
MYEVDESVSDVDIVLEVYWQVKEIIFPAVLFINLLKQSFLGVLIRDVSQHHCSSMILSS